MGAWDETYWDYDYPTMAQRHFAAAVKPDWQNVRQIQTQAKHDKNSNRLGKSGWERLFVLGIVSVDLGRNDSVYLRRGPKWESWWQIEGPLLNGLQMIENRTPISDVL